ncbi:DUF302 domain-containing protein [Hyphobacterium sp.]|uniref:DUF302 domain-containing protein n=1 Tax=Hyphobacterium sp. TaxID=2004662 RepID=UPI003B52CBB7
MRAILAIATTVIATISLSACAENVPEADGVIVLEIEHSLDQTIDRIETEAANRGARIVARVDHAANAATTGVDIDDATLVIFGNPALGTPLIAESRTAGLDLPVRLLVWEEDGDVWLAYTDPAVIAGRHGIDANSEAVKQMSEALSGFAEEVTADGD